MRRPLVDRRAAESTNAGSASSLSGGDRVTFVSERDGNLEIYVMNADGSGVTSLGAGIHAVWLWEQGGMA